MLARIHEMLARDRTKAPPKKEEAQTAATLTMQPVPKHTDGAGGVYEKEMSYEDKDSNNYCFLRLLFARFLGTREGPFIVSKQCSKSLPQCVSTEEPCLGRRPRPACSLRCSAPARVGAPSAGNRAFKIKE